MKSTNVSVRKLVAALNGKRGLNKPVGYAKSVHGQFLVGFIATYAKTDMDGNPTDPSLINKPIWTDDGERVKINWKVSNRQNG